MIEDDLVCSNQPGMSRFSVKFCQFVHFLYILPVYLR